MKDDPAQAGPTPAVAIRSLRFAWPGAPPLLEIEAFELPGAGSLFIHGPSGCGKSTLLGLVSGVLQPSSGELAVLGEPFHAMGGAARDRVRGERMGYVFQQFNLLPYLSARENIAMPGRLFRRRRERAVAHAGSLEAEVERLAQALDLGAELLQAPAHRLSVGQQQRVAAARALFGAPELLIADEPTSALDARRQGEFVALLRAETRRAGIALIMVSHDMHLAEGFDRVAALPSLNRTAAPRQVAA